MTVYCYYIRIAYSTPVSIINATAHTHVHTHTYTIYIYIYIYRVYEYIYIYIYIYSSRILVRTVKHTLLTYLLTYSLHGAESLLSN